MNAGPKTAYGGKRPSTGVFAQPPARELPNVLVPVDDPQNLTRHECRDEDRLRSIEARGRASSHNLLPAILALFSARPGISPFRLKNISSQRVRSIGRQPSPPKDPSLTGGGSFPTRAGRPEITPGIP